MFRKKKIITVYITVVSTAVYTVLAEFLLVLVYLSSSQFSPGFQFISSHVSSRCSCFGANITAEVSMKPAPAMNPTSSNNKSRIVISYSSKMICLLSYICFFLAVLSISVARFTAVLFNSAFSVYNPYRFITNNSLRLIILRFDKSS